MMLFAAAFRMSLPRILLISGMSGDQPVLHLTTHSFVCSIFDSTAFRSFKNDKDI